jgi:hypothetical protein
MIDAGAIMKPGSAKFKFAWLDQVASDEGALLGAATRVAVILCRYINSENGAAWPSMARIAADLNLAERNAQRTIAALVKRGHLEIWPGGGRCKTNRYKPILKTPLEPENRQLELAISNTETLTGTSPFKPINPDRNVTLSNRKPRRNTTINPDGNVTRTLRKNPYPFRDAPASTACADESKSKSPKIKTAHSLSNGHDEAATPEADMFRRGKEVLGKNSGGLISKLLKAEGGSVAKARAAIELAAGKQDPREFLGAVIRSRDAYDERAARERGDIF